MAGAEDKGPQKIVVISGPTAVGKTAISVEIARNFNGEIINADCMQIYRGLNIGTAKPSPLEMGGVPHHLFDILYPDQEFSAGDFKRLADQKISEILSRGRLPVLVGGTGMYLRALLKGLIETPPKDQGIRESLKNRETGSLYRELTEVDPATAKRLHKNDRVRIIRALEVYRLTRTPPSQLLRDHGFREKRYNALCLFLSMERKRLYERIDLRCEEMIKSGLIEEVRGLLEKYPPDLRPFGSIGYRHIKNHLLLGTPLERCLEEFKRDSRRYAKRQFIWFRKEPEFQWIGSEEKDQIFALIENFLNS
ncbi:MAG: tRNA (adenosine(37)-N6)-dimethylallyltransferase MiaA [Desulfatiglandales bacterium]